MKYIEIHSHILPGVDDGVKTNKEAVKVIKKLKQIGYSKIYLTPHYYYKNKQDKSIKYKYLLLKKELKKQKIEVELCLSNELKIGEYLITDTKYYKHNNKAILVEMPANIDVLLYNRYITVLDKLTTNSEIILAHPERCSYLQEHKEKLLDLKNMGIKLQINSFSIINYYGKSAKKSAKYILKNNLYDYISNDIHSYKQTKRIKGVHKKIAKIITKKALKQTLEKEV